MASGDMDIFYSIPIIGIEALKTNKLSTGREKDRLDVKLTERIQADD
jgi:hypothetical protein